MKEATDFFIIFIYIISLMVPPKIHSKSGHSSQQVWTQFTASLDTVHSKSGHNFFFLSVIPGLLL